jgi:Phage derived protein Gp49-like (DUF891)
LSDFPEEVRRRVGGASWEARIGRKAPYAKPLKGFGDAGVLEIVDDFDGSTFRAGYTIRFARDVYVLPEEIQTRRRDAKGRAEPDRTAPQYLTGMTCAAAVLPALNASCPDSYGASTRTGKAWMVFASMAGPDPRVRPAGSRPTGQDEWEM